MATAGGEAARCRSTVRVQAPVRAVWAEVENLDGLRRNLPGMAGARRATDGSTPVLTGGRALDHEVAARVAECEPLSSSRFVLVAPEAELEVDVRFVLAPGASTETVLTYEATLVAPAPLPERRAADLEAALHDHVHDVVERVAIHAAAAEKARRALR